MGSCCLFIDKQEVNLNVLNRLLINNIVDVEPYYIKEYLGESIFLRSDPEVKIRHKC